MNKVYGKDSKTELPFIEMKTQCEDDEKFRRYLRTESSKLVYEDVDELTFRVRQVPLGEDVEEELDPKMPQNWRDMTVEDLQTELTQRGVKYDKRYGKTKLLELLQESI